MNGTPLSESWINRLNIVQLVLAGILVMTPTAWMVLSSFKPSFEVTAYPPTLIFSPTLENYSQLMQTTPFFSYTINSLIVTLGSAGLGLLFGVPAAFAVSWTRISWPAVLTLAARMAPGTLFLLPWYMMFRQVGMIGSYTALILSHAVITLPIVIWVLLPSFDNIPRSIFEAAQVDGCSITRILWKIAMPLVGSGIAVAAHPLVRLFLELLPVRAGAVERRQQDADRSRLQLRRRRLDPMGGADGGRDADCAAAADPGLDRAALAGVGTDAWRGERLTGIEMASIDRTNATMAAAVFHGNERITIERVRIPDVNAGEVLVRVSRTALCGSDFKLWHKGAEFTAGHEIFGVVEQPGHRMHGQRCAVYIPVHCGHCAACRRGDTQMCLEISSLIGWNRPGGYAEYLPVPENCLLPVPDDIEDSLAPLLLDTIGTSAHAVRFVSRVVPPRGGRTRARHRRRPGRARRYPGAAGCRLWRHPRVGSECGAA